jgi:hypothetical protein
MGGAGTVRDRYIVTNRSQTQHAHGHIVRIVGNLSDSLAGGLLNTHATSDCRATDYYYITRVGDVTSSTLEIV